MTRRERAERKADQLRIWADGRDAKADAAHAAVQSITDRIPFGQPILVGHHSERGARADQRRIESGMDRMVEHSAKASEMRARAENIERQAATSIYSDDTDAVAQLAAKVSRLEAKRDRIKAYNATARRRKPDESILTDRERVEIAQLVSHDFRANVRELRMFPPYVLTNLGSEIRRNRQRLEELSTPERGRVLVAKYPGECRQCGESIDRGETVRYFKRTRELEHETCPAE